MRAWEAIECVRVKKKYESEIERMRVNNKCVVASLGDWLIAAGPGATSRIRKKRREWTRVRKYSCGESEKEAKEKEARECRSEHNTFNKFKVITIKNY